jgi:hypothetical protein
MVAVTLAVAALTSVGFFADRLQGGLQRDARSCWAAMWWWSATTHAGGVCAAGAHAGPASVTTLSFPTMGRASDAQGGASRLVALKSVEPATRCAALQVPTTRSARQPCAASRAGRGLVDAPLLDALGLKLGDTLLLGDAQLRIAHHRAGARPRRRLHELCAARDDQRGRPARHRPGAAGQPHHLPLPWPATPRPCSAFGLGRAGGGQARRAWRARGVAGQRPPRDAPDAGPGENS